MSFADSSAEYGCIASLPNDASDFSAIELKFNLLGTVRKGTMCCVASCVHLGHTTQILDYEVISEESRKMLAKFYCIQLVLYR